MRTLLWLCAALVVFLPAAASASAAIPDRYIVVLKDSASAPTGVAKEHGRKYGVEASSVYRHALKGYSAKVPAAGLDRLLSDPKVAFVEPDREGSLATACPQPAGSLPTQCTPTGIDRIDADVSTTVSGDGSGQVNVNIAVLDSGIDASHPDLNVAGAVKCDPGKTQPTEDLEGHGTFVAGVAAARDNGVGVVGVAPGARLWAVDVINKKGRYSTGALICGIDYVISTRTDADPTNDIAVANMSLGGNEGGDHGGCGARRHALHMAICASVAAGVVSVAAAGNDERDVQLSTPGAYNEVLTATAMTDFDGQPGNLAPPCDESVANEADDTPASFSDFATTAADRAHTVAAPGVCLLSTIPLGLPGFEGYARGDGTSFATPHVAGTVALCIASGPCAGLTPAQIVEKIVADAAAYNQANPSYGFTGDPLHSPNPGRFYGYLIRAGLY